ncbi:hypothetical protein Tco_0448906 [Tanacetum coccineum]
MLTKTNRRCNAKSHPPPTTIQIVDIQQALQHAAKTGDRPRCQEAMGGVIAQTRSERASKHSYDSPLLGGNTPRSDEERIEQDDLTDFVPPTPHDSPLSGGHTPGSDEDCSRFGDQKAEKEGQKIRKEAKGKNSKDETIQDCDFAELDVDNAMENVEVNTASIDVSAAGPSNVSTADPSTSTAGDIFEDEMMTIADTLVAIRSTRPRTTSVVIRDVEEEPMRATPIPTIAQILFEEEQAQFEREQRIARERAAEQESKDAALIEQMEDIQARIDADELLAERLQQEDREQFTIEEKSRMLVEMIAERKRFFAHQRAEQIRNKPTNQKDVLKGSRSGSNDFVLWIMEVVKTIESADGSSKNYKIFSEMLDDFDGQYVLDLYRLVKEIFETASPEGYDRLRWGDLITVFESSEDDVDLEANRTTH